MPADASRPGADPSGAAIARAQPGGIFGRIGRNVAWLVGGRGFAGVVSLFYLALAARGLGPTGFGTFSVILAYGGAIANLAQFGSWQAVIRYGATHLADRQPDRLARLLGVTTLLDLAGAIIGAAIAAFGAALVAPLFGWHGGEARSAAMFGALLLLSTGGTATGLLRLYDRFDLLTYAETVGPAARLIGAVIVSAWGASLERMLVVWAIAAIAESAAAWIAVLAMRQARFAFARGAFREAARENPKLWRFLLHNSFSSSLELLWQQSGTLFVGSFGGAAAAGGYRIASKLAGALAKPIETVTRVLYPELARLAARDDAATLAHVARRITLVAAGLAMLLVAAVALFGADLLALLYGARFTFATPYLILLTISAAIDLGGVALEPILNAHGLSGRILAARILGAILHLIALFVLLPTIGPLGAGWAAIAGSLAMRLQMAAFALPRLRRRPA